MNGIYQEGTTTKKLSFKNPSLSTLAFHIAPSVSSCLWLGKTAEDLEVEKIKRKKGSPCPVRHLARALLAVRAGSRLRQL